jgi:hypothetical protein
MGFLLSLFLNQNQCIKDMEKITFDNLPEAVMELHAKIDRLLLNKQNEPPKQQNQLLTIEELMNYLPEHPARQTVYGWVNYRLIPFEKYSKRLYFRKSAIDKWSENGRQLPCEV